jgi:hypothetical protein
MECPWCREDQDETVKNCKCGYVFREPQVDRLVSIESMLDEGTDFLESIDRSVRVIKNLLVWWFILTVGGALACLVVGAHR